MYTYSPRDISINLAGAHSVAGFSGESFISISQPDQTFGMRRAMDGEIARLGRTSDRFIMELTLVQSSTSNDFIQTLFNIDRATMQGKFPILLKDRNGRTTFFAASCWVESTPDVTFSASVGTRTWSIHCCEATMFVGGAGEIDQIYSLVAAGSAIMGYLKDYGLA